MLDHNYSQITRELSKNVVIQGSSVKSIGTDAQKAAREAYKKGFTTVVKVEGQKAIGIKLEVEVLRGTFSPHVGVVFLSVDEATGETRGHTDASIAASSVLLAYWKLKKAISDWKLSDKPFKTILAGFEYEAFYDENN